MIKTMIRKSDEIMFGVTERKLKEYDLTFGEQVIIMYLASHENVNQDTISKTYQIDKSMIAKTLINPLFCISILRLFYNLYLFLSLFCFVLPTHSFQ